MCSIRLWVLGCLPLLLLLLQGCAAVAVSSAATTGFAVATDRRTAGTIVDDQAIQIKAIHALTQSPDLWKQSHINVVSYNNVVLLLGQTPSLAFKQEAERLVRNIPKVREVYNELQMSEPVSFARRSEDSWITTQIKAKMVSTKNIKSTQIKVVTEDATVYLMGLTKPEEEILATEIARAVPKV